MSPVVRLALAVGLKHSHLELVLRELLIDEAGRAWRDWGIQPNISQLSVTTGLNRTALTAKVREPEEPLPHMESSAAAKTLTLWLQLLANDPAPRVLPIASASEAASLDARRSRPWRVAPRAGTCITALCWTSSSCWTWRPSRKGGLSSGPKRAGAWASAAAKDLVAQDLDLTDTGLAALNKR